MIIPEMLLLKNKDKNRNAREGVKIGNFFEKKC